MTLKETLAALDRLRGDVAKTYEALLKHERTLAAGRRNSDHAELHAFVHRMTRLLGDMQPILNEPVPAIR